MSMRRCSRCLTLGHTATACPEGDGVKAPCDVDGCDNPSKARGLCRSHYMKVWRTPAAAEWRIDPAKRAKNICGVDTCSETVKCHGMCHRHYTAARRAGLVGKRNVRCASEGCAMPGILRGFCVVHYYVMKKRGVFGLRLRLAPLLRAIAHGASVGGYSPMAMSLDELVARWEAWQAAGRHCGICLEYVEDVAREPCIDHDHATGAFRGLVHNRCNIVLGYVEKEADPRRLLSNLRRYIGEHQRAYADELPCISLLKTGT
jgi:hypothetical protein